MLTLCAFTALAPSTSYPMSPFEMTLEGVRYELPLPVFVGEAIVGTIKAPKLGFRRLADFCTLDGLELLRSKLSRLDFEAGNSPAYADAELWMERTGERDEPLKGSILNRTIMSSKGALSLLKLAENTDIFGTDVADYLIRREAFLRHCGGFEMLRARYYLDSVERAAALRTLDDSQPNALTEYAKQKTRFKEVARDSLKID